MRACVRVCVVWARARVLLVHDVCSYNYYVLCPCSICVTACMRASVYTRIMYVHAMFICSYGKASESFLSMISLHNFL